MSQATEIEAIKKVVAGTAKTPAALQEQMQFKIWFDNLSWGQKNADAAVLTKARRMRDEFLRANQGVTPPGTAAKPSQKLTIRQGSTGENVKEWQRIVKANPIDGKFGPATKELTVAWQKKNGLVADGVVGPKSWAKALEPNLMNASINAINASAPKPVTPAAKPVVAASPGGTLLRKGATGQAVKDWQKTLGIAQTGTFDQNTVNATIAWQKKNGLQADGIVGPATRAAATMVATKVTTTPAQTVSNAVHHVTSTVSNAVSAAPQAVINAVSAAPQAVANAMNAAPKAVIDAVAAAPQATINAVNRMPVWQKIVGTFVGISGVVLGVKAFKR